MKIIREFSRVILGITFIFSGFVKGIDPLGSTYKFIDYFTAFGTDWANKLAFFLSILLSAVEFGIGVGLLFNYRMKIFSWLVVLFMGF
ncbi:MAG TPA: DoxX family protein, partial [Prolixibacteraceae bacterium]|nr:DoxX family protein [Prolixibacteraceae bacterium]